ncbi:hypothetical protein [Niveibacterium sp. SC-1]|uniref:hypothetical protein n=1 Tax=Niveibacterium sp. SC-1 TaxID=3135646 RepID=UPI00311F003B
MMVTIMEMATGKTIEGAGQERYDEEVLNAGVIPHELVAQLGLQTVHAERSAPVQCDMSASAYAEDFLDRIYLNQE